MTEYGLLQILNELTIEHGNAVVSGNDGAVNTLVHMGVVIANNMIPDTCDGEEEAWHLLSLMGITEEQVIG